MITTIPFCGFYESFYSAALDDAEISIAEDLAANDEAFVKKYDRTQIANALSQAIDYSKVREAIARQYAEHIEDLAQLRMKFERMESPREYNFQTDRIFMTIPRASVRRMRKEVYHVIFRKLVHERFTSCSGFISSYPANFGLWGPLDKWDHNQVGALFEAWLQTKEIEIDDSAIADLFSERAIFDLAIDSAFDRAELLKALECAE